MVSAICEPRPQAEVSVHEGEVTGARPRARARAWARARARAQGRACFRGAVVGGGVESGWARCHSPERPRPEAKPPRAP